MDIPAGKRLLIDDEPISGFFDIEQARTVAKDMAIKDPKGKVVIFEAMYVIEPRKVEFAEKSYNSSGELIV